MFFGDPQNSICFSIARQKMFCELQVLAIWIWLAVLLQIAEHPPSVLQAIMDKIPLFFLT